jgi:hypothetical protein
MHVGTAVVRAAHDGLCTSAETASSQDLKKADTDMHLDLDKDYNKVGLCCSGPTVHGATPC